MYEFTVGKKVWEVFSTREWEDFAKIFHKRCLLNENRTKVEGVTIANITPYTDGRKRLAVTLPDLDWVLLNLPKGRLEVFPVAKMKEEYHVPAYLDFVASLMDNGKGSRSQDDFDKKICKAFGSAKLINIAKTNRKFTVVIYGVFIKN